MKIKVWCGVGLVGDRERVIDLFDEWRITDEEWAEMSEEERMELVEEWANNYIEFGYEELDD